MKQIVIAAAFLLSALLFARAADAPKSIPAPLATENKILKAEHAYDEVLKQEADIRDKFNQLQTAGEQLKTSYQDLQKKDAAAKKAVDDEIEAAWKESGLDKSKYQFDAANFTFTPKVEAKTEAKAQEKK